MSWREGSCCVCVEYQMAWHRMRVSVCSVPCHPSAPAGCVFGINGAWRGSAGQLDLRDRQQ